MRPRGKTLTAQPTLGRVGMMRAVVRVVLKTVSGPGIGVVGAVAKTIGAAEISGLLGRREIALPAA